jgi:copper homeostasis protein
VNRPLVEVCVGSVADIEAAVRAGADRLELCGALELGGLTPSFGLVEAARAATTLPIVAMLRPRAGGFCYDRHEFAAMLRDAERFAELGVDGLVFGVLEPDGTIDAVRCGELVEASAKVSAVFHRAIDFVPDPIGAIDQLAELRFARVLTCGGAATALGGAATIREMVRRAGVGIDVMAGGGIRADHVAELVRLTGCRQIHIGAATGVDDGSTHARPTLELNDGRFFKGSSYRAVDLASVAEVVRALGAS